ncbi:MAG TPA: glycosyltransferase, partial [Acidimicrobiales bacterium]|nr:glycosyltransferase [Acidimicrobiales bacterium]
MSGTADTTERGGGREVVRVGLDVSAVPRQTGGAGRYTRELAGALAGRADVALTLISRRADAERWRSLGEGVEVVPASPEQRALRLAWEQTRLPRLLRSLPIDVHHSPHYTMPEAARVPRVVTIHDLTFFDHPEWHQRTKAAFFRRAIRVAARHSDVVVCVSDSTARRLVDLCRPTGEVRVVRHGVDHHRFRRSEPVAGLDEALLARLGLARPYVAFVGTLEPRKDVPTLVRAFDRVAAAHPDLRLVLAGAPGWGAAAVDGAVAEARRRDRV